MKRLSSSDSPAALITICPSTEEHSPRKNEMYGRELQSMLDGYEEEGCVEEGHHSEKKRRLSVDQVKALEKNFEVENKLEPERKVKLAQELGLQPRQVAVWFQNRRARWKTKQLERDFGVLKANYEALKLNYDTLNQDNQALQKEIKELKSRVEEEKKMEGSNSNPTCIDGLKNNDFVGVGSLFPVELKDGCSESDSSGILNEENSPKGGIIESEEKLLLSQECSPLKFNCLFQFQKAQCVKMEEHNFLSVDEACNFFSDEQPPNLQWYCPDQWT
ncbi:hypothetical protein VNO77_44065 [Canavalia gladiata]|uniref:Homeobox-leucine zipper protein n=1 Tax=Canavalia gladiata TaxID=3824 RepID=A0AAN9JYY5_CANGL